MITIDNVPITEGLAVFTVDCRPGFVRFSKDAPDGWFEVEHLPVVPGGPVERVLADPSRVATTFVTGDNIRRVAALELDAAQRRLDTRAGAA